MKLKLESSRGYWTLAGLLILVGALLRLWDLDSKPGYDWDEPVYTSVGTNFVENGFMGAKTEYNQSPEPYLYHPPFYFQLLRMWFWVFGPGVPQARYLGALGAVLTLVVLAAFLRKLMGAWALLAVALVAFDGWIIFTNRVSWIENTMMLLGILALWAYWHATKNPTYWRFIGAGAALGGVAIYKHVGIYFLGAVIIACLFERKEIKKHLAMVGTTVGVLLAYVGGMILVFGDFYLNQSGVQFTRVTGDRASRGALSGLGDFIQPLLNQYKVFWLTIVLMVAGGIALLWVFGRSVALRSLSPVRANALLVGWALAGVVFFAGLQLKLPHYFSMLVIPFYAYLAAVVGKWYASHTVSWQKFALVAGVVLFVGVNMGTYWVRIVSREDNALLQVADWMAANAPADARVVTEESVGTLIEQPYCKMFRAAQCVNPKNPGGGAEYVIFYTSTTQQPPDIQALHQVQESWNQRVQFTGFKETITVYERP